MHRENLGLTRSQIHTCVGMVSDKAGFKALVASPAYTAFLEKIFRIASIVFAGETIVKAESAKKVYQIQPGPVPRRP